MVGPGDADLLPQAVLRQIGDKLYEKRKVAALEVEQVRRRSNSSALVHTHVHWAQAALQTCLGAWYFNGRTFCLNFQLS